MTASTLNTQAQSAGTCLRGLERSCNYNAALIAAADISWMSRAEVLPLGKSPAFGGTISLQVTNATNAGCYEDSLQKMFRKIPLQLTELQKKKT